MAVGQELVSSDGVRWHFDSGALSLDLAYTGDFGLGRPQWERWHRPQDLARWFQVHLPFEVEPVSDEDLDSARVLRAAISSAARALSTGGTIRGTDSAVLDAVAEHPDVPPRLQAHGGRPATVPEALSVIARDFITAVASRPERVRVCAADDCGLIFLDTSRPGSRRWCSMQRCGNRAKARQHRRHDHAQN